MAQPFPYQSTALSCLSRVRRQGQDRGLVVMASGLGKTLTSAFDVKRWLSRNDGRVLYLCHQNDILEQARQSFEEVIGKTYTYGYLNGREKNHKGADCVFASFQSIGKLKRKFKRTEFGYIIVDESHHSHAHTYKPTLNYFRPQFLLGLTATPERADLQDIRTIYGEEVFSLPLDEALAQGFLTRIIYLSLWDEIQSLKVLKTLHGRVSVKELNRKLFIPKRDEEIIRIIKQRSRGIRNPRTMIFCRSITYCERFSKKIPGSVAIHSLLSSKQRVTRLEAFRKGEAHTVLTVDVFNEGIDIPEANVIVFLRSTSSPNVFFQQLGRGLRKISGKEKVIVLDFVGNVERLETVHQLHVAVQQRYRELHQRDHEPMELNIGEIHFTEVVQPILEYLARIREGYSKESLIKQLQGLAKELRRNPTIQDIDKASKARKTASQGVFARVFGSYNNALKAAGLPVNIFFGYTKPQLLNQLKAESRRLQRTPTKTDIEKASKEGRMASSPIFAKHFGSFTKALIAAGFRANLKSYSKPTLLRQLRAEARRLKRTPTTSDIQSASKEGRTASTATFASAFGSFGTTLQAAGFEPNQNYYTKSLLLKQLRAERKRLGRRPNSSDIQRAHREGRTASLDVFLGRLGKSWKAVRAAAGWKEVDRRAQLLKELKTEASRLGKVPSCEDIKRASKEGRTASTQTFSRYFGSWHKALRAAGFYPKELKARRVKQYSKDLLLKELKAEVKRLKRIPTHSDLIAGSKAGRVATGSSYRKCFGSLSNALEAAGIKPNRRTFYKNPKDLVRELRVMKRKLGRTPRLRDFDDGSKMGKTPSSGPFRKTFGSWSAALKAAGLK